MSKEAMKLALEAAYLAGFNVSGEGYNGEYPFRDHDSHPEQDACWLDERSAYIGRALAKPDFWEGYVPEPVKPAQHMKTVIEMAQEADVVPYIVGPTNSEYIGRLERFAELVRADEREACAKMAETYREWDDTGMGIAAAIRARSNT